MTLPFVYDKRQFWSAIVKFFWHSIPIVFPLYADLFGSPDYMGLAASNNIILMIARYSFVPTFTDVFAFCLVFNTSQAFQRAQFAAADIMSWGDWLPHYPLCTYYQHTKNPEPYNREEYEKSEGVDMKGYTVFGYTTITEENSLLMYYNLVLYSVYHIIDFSNHHSAKMYARSCDPSSYYLQETAYKVTVGIRTTRICNQTCNAENGFMVVNDAQGCCSCVASCKLGYDTFINISTGACEMCPNYTFSTRGSEYCLSKELVQPVGEYFILLPLCLSQLGMFATLLLAVILVVNGASPVVKASSIQITRYIILGMVFTFFALIVVCVAVSTLSCMLFRLFVSFGYSTRYMAICLYVARLRKMTGAGSAGRKKQNCCSLVFNKFFSVLGHAKAVLIVPWIVWAANAVIVALLLYFYPESYEDQIIDPQHYWEFFQTYRICSYFYHTACPLCDIILPVFFLVTALAISVQAKAVSEFLRQDTQVLLVFLFFLYCYANLMLVTLVAGEEPTIRFYGTVLLLLLEVWITSAVIWNKRTHILLACRELNTRENVTKISKGKGAMPQQTLPTTADKFSMTRLIQSRRHSAVRSSMSSGSITSRATTAGAHTMKTTSK